MSRDEYPEWNDERMSNSIVSVPDIAIIFIFFASGRPLWHRNYMYVTALQLLL